MEKLNFLTFGAGAIGTYIGGSLALAGHQVTFLEQPKVAGELAQRGLRLELQNAENSSFVIPHSSFSHEGLHGPHPPH